MNKDERAELRELVATHASAKGATEPYSLLPKWVADGPRVCLTAPEMEPSPPLGEFVRVRFAEYAVASINVARFAQPLLHALDAADTRIAELEKRVEELSAAEEEVVEMAPVEEGLSVLDCTQPSVESLRRRIRHQRREIRMLHRLREMESVSARRGREIALARMYVPFPAIPDGAADAIRAAHHSGTLATVVHPDGSIWAVAWRAEGGA